MTKIKIAMLPIDIRQADPAGNISQVKHLAGNLDKDTDIICLPELFTTGFIKDREEALRLSEDNNGTPMTALRQLSRNYGMAVTGSFMCRDKNTLRNRAFFINPDDPDGNDTEYYDKHHLFVLSEEKRIFEAGNELPPVSDFRGWKIAITVCYDLRFPVWMRNTDNRYDMMIVPANWPDSRGYAWKSLLVARAIENQAVYIGVNRTGNDDFGSYSPTLTTGVNELGMPVTELSGSIIRYAVFSLDEINTLRRRFPFYLNSDRYKLI